MVLNLAELTARHFGRQPKGGTAPKCHDCSAAPMPGKSRCAVHAELQRQYNAKYYAKVAATRPPREPRPKPEGGYNKRWREQKIAVGLCPQCGKHPPADGYTRCDTCREYNRNHAEQQRRTKGAKPQQKSEFAGLTGYEYLKAVKFDQRAKGLCEHGRCQQPPDPGHFQCRPHLDALNRGSKARGKQRRAAGLCRQCGQPWTETVICPTCRPRKRGRADARRARAAREAEAARGRAAEKQQAIDLLERHIHVIRDERTKTILRRRVNGDTLEAIGHDLNITRERVRQIEKKASQRIARAALVAHGPLTDFSPIANIDISSRLERVLVRMGITTLYELRQTPARLLFAQKSFGKRCMQEVDELLDIAQDNTPPPLEGLS